MSCSICIEEYNKSNRKKIACICEFECCKSCIQTYILNSNIDPHCMSCKVQWEYKTIVNNLGLTFINNEYKTYKQNLLFERERGLLQATQPYIEHEIKIKNLEDQLKEKQAIIDELIKEKNDIKTKIYQLKNNKKPVEKVKIVKKCPNNDCHGFLSLSLKCSLCSCIACTDCKEIKGFTEEEANGHECDKNILESIKLLNNDSKPCPKCSSLIFKIAGCDQMYCVECHTAFSWRTLKIETGAIHNPHYFEYHRRQNNGNVPRNPLDVRCGRGLDHNFAIHINRLKILEDNTKEILIKICRNTIHIREVECPRFQNNILEKNLKVRILYMKNEIPPDEFKTQLYRKEKEHIKKNDIYNVLTMYVSCMTDLLYRIYETTMTINNKKESEKNFKVMKKEMEQLRVYTNECLTDIGKVYNCKQYVIDDIYNLK